MSIEVTIPQPTDPADVPASEQAVLRALGCAGTEARPCDIAEVVGTAPRFSGAVTVTAKPGGVLVVDATGMPFGSFGLRVLVDGAEAAAVVLHDASCNVLDGDAAIDTLFELIREPFAIGPTPIAALTDADCGAATPTAAPARRPWLTGRCRPSSSSLSATPTRRRDSGGR